MPTKLYLTAVRFLSNSYTQSEYMRFLSARISFISWISLPTGLWHSAGVMVGVAKVMAVWRIRNRTPKSLCFTFCILSQLPLFYAFLMRRQLAPCLRWKSGGRNGRGSPQGHPLVVHFLRAILCPWTLASIGLWKIEKSWRNRRFRPVCRLISRTISSVPRTGARVHRGCAHSYSCTMQQLEKAR